MIPERSVGIILRFAVDLLGSLHFVTGFIPKVYLSTTVRLWVLFLLTYRPGSPTLSLTIELVYSRE
jgi:hypothetical protein